MRDHSGFQINRKRLKIGRQKSIDAIKKSRSTQSRVRPANRGELVGN